MLFISDWRSAHANEWKHAKKECLHRTSIDVKTPPTSCASRNSSVSKECVCNGESVNSVLQEC